MLRIMIVLLFNPLFTLAQVGIGTTTPNAKAQLDISSTTKGFLPPRMNESQRLAINPSTAGLMVYQTDGTAGLWYYSGSSWIYIINSTSATLPVANGGTGATTLTGVLIGNGTNAVTAVAPGSSGNVLISNGADWVSSTTLTVPTGAITAFAGSSAPTGYLLCDGSALSRTTYSNLFAVIGTTYGGGNGSTTFNLPDLRGRAIFGIDNMGGIAASRLTTAGGLSANNTLGASAGSQTITLQETNLPSHSHLYQDAYFAEGVGGGVNNIAGSGSTDYDNSFRWRTSTNGTSNSIQNLNTGISGSGTAIQINPPLLVLNYIIKF
jgi:microcystin-dependent protein